MENDYYPDRNSPISKKLEPRKEPTPKEVSYYTVELPDGSIWRAVPGPVVDHLSAEIRGKEKTISKLQGKLNQQVLTIDHLHDRLSRIKNSNKNKASQIARLKKEANDRMQND